MAHHTVPPTPSGPADRFPLSNPGAPVAGGSLAGSPPPLLARPPVPGPRVAQRRRIRQARRSMAATAAVGLLLGASVSSIGFADYGQLHAMFTFADLRMLGAFIGALALTVVAFRVMRVARPRRPLHRGLVIGGAIYGTGWAISGGCPGVVLAQLGLGYVPALATAAGAMVGMVAFRWANGRLFAIDAGSCAT